MRKETKGTKTATVRDIELVPEALAALRDQKPATFLRGDLVFRHPATGEAINDDKPPRLVMSDALRALGIRHRPTYNTRHTFATLAIMAGANPLWLSRQLGHTTPQTTFRAYARWIDAAASQAEAQKIGAIFGEHPREHPGAPRSAQTNPKPPTS